MKQEEMTAREISERLGVPLACVFYYARKLGVVCKKGCLKRKLSDRNEMIVCLVRNGFSYRSIADSFGVSFQRIEQIVNIDKS